MEDIKRLAMAPAVKDERRTTSYEGTPPKGAIKSAVQLAIENFHTPDREIIEAQLPYEKRKFKAGKSKMELLFVGGAKGPSVLIFFLRMLLFINSILMTLVILWAARDDISTMARWHAISALVPLVLILFFAPVTLLPLVVFVTSVEQLKAPGVINDTEVEMQLENSMHVLKTLTIIASQVKRAAMFESGVGRDSPATVNKSTAEERARQAEAVKSLTKQQLNELKSAFDLFDEDGSRSIDEVELGNLLRTLGMTVSDDAVQRMLAEMDSDGNGTVEFHEFVGHMATHGYPSALMTPRELVDRIFELLDQDHSGQISTDELRQTLIRLGAGLEPAQIDQAMHMFDVDGSGEITKDEFLKVLEMMSTFVSLDGNAKR